MTGKLVRDNIPDLIRAGGGKPITYVADADEYRRRLRAKLVEEVEEFLDSDDPRELADITEVVAALAEDLGATWGQLEAWRIVKKHQRGGFAGRVVWLGNEGDKPGQETA